MRYPDIPTFNGRDRDIDLRRRFDIFLSRTRFVAMEEGKVLIDAPIYRAIPAGRYQVHFLHHLYHSINDHMDLKKYSPFDILWLYRTPYYDVRHWDNMGIQVVRGLQDVFDDSIPPLVVLSTPKTGEIVRGNVHVFATAHDNLRVVRCELWVDGRLVRTQRSGIDTKWNSNTAANGPHSLRVTAYDDSGNAGFSSVATVVVRN
jgi:hypothetical protein